MEQLKIGHDSRAGAEMQGGCRTKVVPIKQRREGLESGDHCFGVTPLVQSQSFGLGESFQWLLSRCVKAGNRGMLEKGAEETLRGSEPKYLRNLGVR